jgi:hypothetical protein
VRFAVRRPSNPVASPLLHHLRALPQPIMLRAGGCELSALLKIARRVRPARMPVSVLLDRKVPHVPGVRAMTLQHCLLGGCGKQPVPRHTNTLATATDIPGEVRRRFLPGLKARISASRSL